MLQCTATTVFTKKTVDMVINIKADKCLPFSYESVSALSGRQRYMFIVYTKEQVEEQEVQWAVSGPAEILGQLSSNTHLINKNYTLYVQVAL